MLTGARWDLNYVRRAAAIAVAVTAVGFAWSTASARDAVPSQAKAPGATVRSADPGQNARYWIHRINAPLDGTEPARALWITPES